MHTPETLAALPWPELRTLAKELAIPDFTHKPRPDLEAAILAHRPPSTGVLPIANAHPKPAAPVPAAPSSEAPEEDPSTVHRPTVTPSTPATRLVGIRAIAHYLRRSIPTAYGYCTRYDDFPAAKIGGEWHSDKAKIDAWFEAKFPKTATKDR